MEAVLRTLNIPRNVNWWSVWLWVLGGLTGLLLLLLGSILFYDVGTPPDLMILLGRFHPSIVHFPIGVLVLAVLLEGSAYFYSVKTLRLATSFVVTFGAVSAVVAVVVGYFLSLSGGYNSEIVGWHKWAGIVAAVGAVLASGLNLLYLSQRSKNVKNLYRGVLFATVGILLYAGHLGGTLTHGSGYLTEYMPGSVKSLIGVKHRAEKDRGFPVVEEAEIYGDLIQPILKERCVECHGNAKTKGDLRLDSIEAIKEGGEDGEIIVPGKPQESDLYRRITLPLYHEDVMPPKGHEPLGVRDTELIRWWIKSGASFEKKVKQVQNQPVPSSVQTVLDRLSKPASERRTGIFALDVDGPDPEKVEEIRERGIRIRYLSSEKTFLEVDFSDQTGEAYGPIDRETLESLKPVYQQIAWLNLAGTEIKDGALEVLSKFKHLTRLNLRDTSVKSEDLRSVSSLEYLEYINLVGTKVNDRVLTHLKKLNSLNSLFLWRSDVSEKALEELKKQNETLTVNAGEKMGEIPEDFTYLSEKYQKEEEKRKESVPDPAELKRVAPVPSLSGLRILAASGTANSEQNSKTAARHALDGSPKSMWQSKYKPETDDPPYSLVIDLQKKIAVKGLTYLPPQDMKEGRIGSYSVSVSDDGKKWTDPVASGEWKNTAEKQKATFSSAQNTQYLRLKTGGDVNGKKRAAAAEIGLLSDEKGKLMYRVNCAGEELTVAGQTWLADQGKTDKNEWGYIDGNTADRGGMKIKNTDMDPIFRLERWGTSGYEFDLPGGTYAIRLLFAETYHKEFQEGIAFNVLIEGETAIEKFHIFQESGFATALQKVFTGVEVTDGTLNINFKEKSLSKINGIEIFRQE